MTTDNNVIINTVGTTRKVRPPNTVTLPMNVSKQQQHKITERAKTELATVHSSPYPATSTVPPPTDGQLPKTATTQHVRRVSMWTYQTVKDEPVKPSVASLKMQINETNMMLYVILGKKIKNELTLAHCTHNFFR